MTCYSVAAIAASVAWVAMTAAPADAGRDPFHDPSTLNARLRELHDASPTTTRIVTIASGKHGEVLSLEVDPSGRFDADAPILLLQGGVHGNEWISTEVVLRLAELVTESRHARWNGLTYRFIPAVNVDGFAKGTRKAFDDVGKAYDANREFPVPAQPDHPSRPLIQALRDYVLTGKVVAVLDYHSAAECLLWPWAYTRDDQPPDVEALAAVTSAMATSVGYCSGQVSKVIRYKHQGTAADWYQHALQAPTILVELAAVDDPGSQTVEQILIDQERPFAIFLAWLEQRGVKQRGDGPAVAAPGVASSCIESKVSVGHGVLGYRATGPLCDGLRHGPWTFTFLTGEPMRTGEYVRGLEQGTWRTFHRAGPPQDVGVFTDGKPEGPWVRQDPAGVTIEARSFSGGWRDGPLLRWSPDGSLWQVRTCSQGMCTTQCKTTKKRPCKPPPSAPVIAN